MAVVFILVFGLADALLPLDASGLTEPSDAAPATPSQLALHSSIEWKRTPNARRTDELYISGVLRGPFSARHAYAFVAEAATLVLPDGTRGAVDVEEPNVFWLSSPTILDSAAGGTLRPTVTPGHHYSHLDIEPNQAQREAIRRGDAVIEMRGHLIVLEPRMTVSVAARSGATAAGDGKRLRVTDAAEDADGLSFTIRSSYVRQDEPGSLVAMELAKGTFEYVLLPGNGQHAEVLWQSGGGGSGATLVLPGPMASEMRVELTTVERFGATDAARIPDLTDESRIGVFVWDLAARAPLTTSIPTRVPVAERR